MAAPANWFGPSWHYFPQLPHNGFGMGLCCTILGLVQMLALLVRPTPLILSILFGTSAFVYWTAGTILAAEGILGHQGLMESPFIMVIALNKLINSAALMAHHREDKRTPEDDS